MKYPIEEDLSFREDELDKIEEFVKGYNLAVKVIKH